MSFELCSVSHLKMAQRMEEPDDRILQAPQQHNLLQRQNSPEIISVGSGQTAGDQR